MSENHDSAYATDSEENNIVDEASEESFPASDPPAWIGHQRGQGKKTVLENLPVTRCEVCGNDYDKPILVIMAGRQHTFDSFECAIHALAPTCAHCGCRVIGHGLERDGTFYCCATCAHHAGVSGFIDRT